MGGGGEGGGGGTYTLPDTEVPDFKVILLDV